MGLRKHVLVPPLEGILRPLNEELEDLGHGIGDERILDGANISIRKLRRKNVGQVTVGTDATLVRHGLGVVPEDIQLTPTSAGQVWLVVGKTDEQRLYLQADAADRTVLVVVSA